MSNQGYADVVVGLQYGDEGKARVVDDLAKNYDFVARFNGGANAGHTVEANGVRVALNQVPSGVFYPGKQLYVGSGCVVNLTKLARELDNLANVNLDVVDRLHISPQAGVVQPHHVALDTVIGGKVGTTKNGIGPAYADRAFRMWDSRLLNLRMGDLVVDPEGAVAAMRANFEFVADHYDLPEMDIEAELAEILKNIHRLGPLVERDPLYLLKQVKSGKTVIFEGAQSFMLDVNKGSVPYVTSSHTAAPAAYLGGDLPPEFHRKTIGVAKVIMSRVGHGPFTSEFGGKESEAYSMAANPDGSPTYSRAVESEYDIEALLASGDPFKVGQGVRYLSGEYGTVTTRPRRVGAFDLVQLNYAAEANGVDELVLTKCDLLNVYSRTKEGQLPLVTAYQLEGERIDFVPGATGLYAKCTAIQGHRPVFSEDISDIREYSELPSSLRDLVGEVEQMTGCRVVGLGVGPGRDQYVHKN